jgi:hypothetical protein
MNKQVPVNSYFDALGQLVYSLLYNTMYVFSVLQIKYHRVTKTLKHPYVGDRTDEYQIELFHKGDPIQLEFPNQDVTKMLCFLKNSQGETLMGDESLVVYTNFFENGVNDKVLLRNGCNININANIETSVLDYEQAGFTFISVELVLDDLTTCSIQLRNGDDNYYIVGNVIDRRFIDYYTKKYLNFKEDIQKYTLHIVDGNANFFTITQEDAIVFEKSRHVLLLK